MFDRWELCEALIHTMYVLRVMATMGKGLKNEDFYGCTPHDARYTREGRKARRGQRTRRTTCVFRCRRKEGGGSHTRVVRSQALELSLTGYGNQVPGGITYNSNILTTVL